MASANERFAPHCVIQDNLPAAQSERMCPSKSNRSHSNNLIRYIMEAHSHRGARWPFSIRLAGKYFYYIKVMFNLLADSGAWCNAGPTAHQSTDDSAKGKQSIQLMRSALFNQAAKGERQMCHCHCSPLRSLHDGAARCAEGKCT